MSKVVKKNPSKKISSSHVHAQNTLFVAILAAALLIIGISSVTLFKPSTTKAPVVVEKNSIIVEPQNWGGTVNISKVDMEKPGFIIIRQEDDKVVGVSKYLPANAENVIVDLYITTMSKQNLKAELRLDDGNKKFNVQKDLQVKNSSGNVVSTNFSIN